MKKLLFTLFLSLFTHSSHATPLNVQHYNNQFIELAHLLIQDDKNPIFNRAALNTNALDYSLESLNLISVFLINSNQNGLISSTKEDVAHFINSLGAYVGETIRKNDKNREWYWVNYDEIVKEYPAVGQYYPKAPSTEFLMAGIKQNDSTVHFSFPMNKIIENLAYGNEDNVYDFAILQLQIDEQMKNRDASK